MRSVPKQERGERRIQLILHAAEQLFAELGYKAVTTNEIAARAHTSIGTLYRFFPNKEAIVQHLTEQYMQELHAIHYEMFRPEAVTMPLQDLIDHLVDPIVALKFAHPGLVLLYIDSHVALQAPPEFQQLLDESVMKIEELWTQRFPHLAREMCHLYAVIFFQIRLAFLSLAFMQASAAQEPIITELKNNLFRYLEPIDNKDRTHDATGHTPNK